MGEVEWERACLFPVPDINGADKRERRAASAFLAVVQLVRELGAAIMVPVGTPAGRLSAYIEVPFSDGDKRLRPDGLLQVMSGQRTSTALVEVKTGRHGLITGKIQDDLNVARKHKFDALLNIFNQVVDTLGEALVTPSRPKTQSAGLYHLSWSRIRTEALIQQLNKSIGDPDQAWKLAEFIRYLQRPRSGALDFDDMRPTWAHVRRPGPVRSQISARRHRQRTAVFYPHAVQQRRPGPRLVHQLPACRSRNLLHRRGTAHQTMESGFTGGQRRRTIPIRRIRPRRSLRARTRRHAPNNGQHRAAQNSGIRFSWKTQFISNGQLLDHSAADSKLEWEIE